jgi:MerR family transcriptional regulator, copper efflux regulator
MLINELAKKTGMTAHTIRFYEKSGLIKGKRKEDVKSNNYFHYDEETIEKLELIGYAKEVGFTLSEINQLIDAWYDKKFTIPQKIAILDEKLQSIDKKIQQLEDMKKLIAEFKADVLIYDC